MRQNNHHQYSSNIIENTLIVILDDISDSLLNIIQKDVLETIVQKSLRAVILDISKITVIDTVSANLLGQLIEVIDIMGSKGILTGIRAEVALCLITLDIKLNSLHTELNIEESFKYLKGIEFETDEIVEIEGEIEKEIEDIDQEGESNEQ